MSALRDFQAALAAYADPRGLAADLEDHCCVWQTDDGFTLEISLDPNDETALLRAPLAEWPPLEGHEPATLRTLLEANLAGVGSRGGVFALDDSQGELVIYRRVAAGIDAHELAAAIDDLYAAGREFSAELNLRPAE